jgi:LCP family protein required for cell wall assembly
VTVAGGRRPLRWLVGALLVLGLVGAAVLAPLWRSHRQVADALNRLPRAAQVFDIPEADRPARADGGESPAARRSRTFLVVGSDARREVTGAAVTAAANLKAGSADENDGAASAVAADWVQGEQRSDVIMVGRLDATGSVALVSIPRDSWVEVPGHGKAKINAAYSWGGPQLLVRTVERLTGVRIDHFAAVDFTGLAAITDAIGGVELVVPQNFSYGGHTFTKGRIGLDGEAALAFVRNRRLPRGDLDRIENQQRFLRALFGQVVSREVAGDDKRLDRVLDAVVRHVTVDEDTDVDELREVGKAMGGTPSSRVVAGTAPVAGPGRAGGQSVVYLDTTRAAAVWDAFDRGQAASLRELLD